MPRFMQQSGREFVQLLDGFGDEAFKDSEMHHACNDALHLFTARCCRIQQIKEAK